MALTLVDSHCHISMIEGQDGTDSIISSAHANDVMHMLCVSVDLDTYPDILEIAQKYDSVSASVGIHPNSMPDNEPGKEELVEYANDASVVAIGETGLDYFRSEGDLEWQRERFRTHIRAAKTVSKPLIIHCREAKDDVIRILDEEGAAEVGGVMHCFVEDIQCARAAIEMNFLISFSGIVTFKNAQPLKEVAKELPLEKILIETDSPYLAPVPFRGKENTPAYVRYVAEHLAELRSESLEFIAEQTSNNFFELFAHAQKSV